MTQARISILQNPIPAELARIDAFLAPYTPSCMFMRYNLAAELEKGRKLGTYYIAEEEGEITCVIGHYWNGNILMQGKGKSSLAHLVTATNALLSSTKPSEIKGILGDAAQAAVVIDTLGLDPKWFRTDLHEDLYTLPADDLVQMPKRADLECRTIKEQDQELVTKWILDYEVESLSSIDTPELRAKAGNYVKHLIKTGRAWLLMKTSTKELNSARDAESLTATPCAFFAFNAQIPNWRQLGPVYTPPEYRNSGYASYLIMQVLVDITEEAKNNGEEELKFVLFTSHPAAKRVYERVGFSVIGEFRLALGG